MRKNVTLQDHIDELTKRRAEIDREIATDDADLQRLITLGKNLSEIVEAKRERKQRIEYAIMNLQALIELETPADGGSQEEVDPWGDAG
jgi:hypothetical protein